MSYKLNIIQILLLLCGSGYLQAQPLSIQLTVNQSLADTSISRLAIEDVTTLLRAACNCPVDTGIRNASVHIVLPEVNAFSASAPTAFSQQAQHPYKHYPEHGFTWSQKTDNNQYVLMLEAKSWQGVSFGLYALLQEKLGFRFYHPRETIIPDLKEWPLKERFEWQGTPLFDKKGFHLHTQHPLELTEQLHDGTLPNALEDVKEYVDWLARNGQNYFEFCLLNSIDKKVWIQHARNITDYVHQRGLIAAVDLSLHMIQQKTFQLYTSPVNKKKQIEKNLHWLKGANFDVINMEFSTAEFIGGNRSKKEQLRQFILNWLLQNSSTKLMGRQHVVRHENEISTGKKTYAVDSAAIALDKHRGVLSHTVMFYDMTEPRAPVYENDNLRHMFRFLLDEHAVRETWYYPESAYWITFDNSVPMLLLPYLSARLKDIDTCAAYRIPGHITFSSGWEWGYWLIDWSIARWSWQYSTNGINEIRYPTMYAHQVLPKETHAILDTLLHTQQAYLKDSLLMQWMVAMTVTDELPIKALANQYHPRPQPSYKIIRNKAPQPVLDSIQKIHIPLLQRFGRSSLKQTAQLRDYMHLQNDTNQLLNELTDGLEVTGLRALHRVQTLGHIIEIRQSKISKRKADGSKFLADAADIRHEAQAFVNQREQRYRYPVSLIARKRWDHTAYHFGYLYPVSNLHFWSREEAQARTNNYRALYKNIWHIGRIIGLVK